MKVWGFLLLLTAVCGFVLPRNAMAQGPWGEMSADPNPCRIEPGHEECTAHIRWKTRNVERVKVFVTSEGKHHEVEHEFSTQLHCEEHNCRAPWISADTRYKFELFDFTKGDRGRLLGTVTVRGEH